MIAAGEKIVTLEGVASILFKKEKVDLTPATMKKAETNFNFLREFSKNKVIYGINTGFGPMAQHRIPYAERLTLQYNLIRSHAGGSGKPIDTLFAKAMLIDRLNTFAQCKSGVHPDLLLLIRDMI